KRFLHSSYLPHAFFFYGACDHRYLHSFPTRRSSDLFALNFETRELDERVRVIARPGRNADEWLATALEYEAEGKTRAEAIDAYEDRKSTRLNSSHVSISYAVFCLKKKKKLL